MINSMIFILNNACQIDNSALVNARGRIHSVARQMMNTAWHACWSIFYCTILCHFLRQREASVISFATLLASGQAQEMKMT